jgi:hypothetical protein
VVRSIFVTLGIISIKEVIIFTELWIPYMRKFATGARSDPHSSRKHASSAEITFASNVVNVGARICSSNACRA